MTATNTSTPRLVLFAAGVALSLSAWSAATGEPERPANQSDLLRAVTEQREALTELRTKATRLEARVAELEKRHPRLSNAEVLRRLDAVVAKHDAEVTTLEAEPEALTLKVRVVLSGSKGNFKSISEVIEAIKSELRGTGACSGLRCGKVAIHSAPDSISADLELLRPPLE